MGINMLPALLNGMLTHNHTFQSTGSECAFHSKGGRKDDLLMGEVWF